MNYNKSMLDIVGLGSIFVDYFFETEVSHLKKIGLSIEEDCLWEDKIGKNQKLFLKGLELKAKSLGGMSVNTIMVLSKLGFQCGMTGIIGNDDDGNFVRDNIKGIDIDEVSVGGNTAKCFCLITNKGKERTFVSRFSNFQIPPPSNWQDFESLCCDLWREIWEDPNTKKNGRQGQPQNGVDIYGRHHKGNLWSGIQCKCKNNDLNRNLTESEVYNEVQKAKKSLPKLSEFIIATTGPKDARIEEFARKITHEHLKEGLFSVDIWGWDDIKEYLDNFPSIRSKYYPEININLDDIKRKENDNHFKRENAGKIIEKVIRPLRNCAKYIKPYFKNGDYILNLENKAINLNLKFNGYEFIQICEESNRFRLKDENLVFTYKKDEILNRSISRIISYLDNYREHFIALKTAIETLNTSNVPTSFESDIAVLIENESKKYDLAEDERKEEFLFKLYATVVTGKGTFSGHDWATTLKKTKSKEVLKIIKKDPYSNETFTKIEYLNNEIILNIDELINELNNLDEELQNAYCL